MSLKARWLGAAGILGLAIGAALGAPAVAPASAADAAQPLKCDGNPLIGTWRLNIAKSHITRNHGVIKGRLEVNAPYGANGMTHLFLDDDDKRLSAREETWPVQFDGKPYPTEGGDPRFIEMRRIDCNTFEMTTVRQMTFNPDGSVKQYFPEGLVQGHSRTVVAPDGKSYTSTLQGKLGNQQDLKGEILFFDRL